MTRGRDLWHTHYVSVPRRARGGIRARSKRGSFGEKWWSRRWVEYLENIGAGSRLGRGRNYARLGQVLDIRISPGEVTAKVQGSRVRPYRVAIRMKILSPAQWRKVAGLVARRPLLAAKLLAGEMPPEIDDIFAEAKLALFPAGGRDLLTDCSCPDWENPCKHIAAVYYLLGEEFDRDPFLIFRLRGIERQELAGLVVGVTGGQSGVAPGEAEAARAKPTAAPKEKAEATRHRAKKAQRAGDEAPGFGEPLPADPGAFWGVASGTGEAVEAADKVTGGVPGLGWDARVPLVPASLPKRLGGFPFWRGREDFIAAMEDIYRRASAAGLRAFLGEEPIDGPRTEEGPEPSGASDR